MFKHNNIDYEVAEKSKGINYGGIGLFHFLLQRIGLDKSINARIKLLKQKKPYFESDHVFNICENVLVGHQRLEDIELLRQDENYLDALDVERIPDPTRAGDFLRCFFGRRCDRVDGVHQRFPSQGVAVGGSFFVFFVIIPGSNIFSRPFSISGDLNSPDKMQSGQKIIVRCKTVAFSRRKARIFALRGYQNMVLFMDVRYLITFFIAER